MFSIVTVASSTRNPDGERQPLGHQLSVCPGRRPMMEASTASGIDRDDQRAAPAAQEQEDHQGREEAREASRMTPEIERGRTAICLQQLNVDDGPARV